MTDRGGGGGASLLEGIMPVRTFYVRTAKHENIPGVRTFHVPSESTPVEYTVKRVAIRSKRKDGRRDPRGGPVRWICSCGDWVNRKGPLKQKCKHIKLLIRFIEAVGGLRQIPHGRIVKVER